MNIVFMGTPDFAVYTLRALCESGERVTGVVTQPDRPRGRKKEITPGPVKAEAVSRGIPVYQPEKLRRNPEALEAIRDMRPDLIVVAAFGMLIPKEILDLPPFGCVNVHASLLPAYRGAAPIQHMILDGVKTAGVTIMQMNEGLDTGDIISVWETPVSPDETGGSLFDTLAEGGAELLVRTLPSIFDGTAERTPQPVESTTAYASMISKSDGEIDWNGSAVYIERQIRAMNPWPCAYTHLEGKLLRIWRASVLEDPPGADAPQGTPGAFEAVGEGILVRCGEGVLCVKELQMEGRRRMASSDFLRGYSSHSGQFS